jgi:hypothetical protein
MGKPDLIQEYVRRLPEPLQDEVLDFVEFLLHKAERENGGTESQEWTRFSLATALRDMEDKESPYSLSDLQESLTDDHL